MITIRFRPHILFSSVFTRNHILMSQFFSHSGSQSDFGLTSYSLQSSFGIPIRLHSKPTSSSRITIRLWPPILVSSIFIQNRPPHPVRIPCCPPAAPHTWTAPGFPQRRPLHPGRIPCCFPAAPYTRTAPITSGCPVSGCTITPPCIPYSSSHTLSPPFHSGASSCKRSGN